MDIKIWVLGLKKPQKKREDNQLLIGGF
jgi:hypothetical protein